MNKQLTEDYVSYEIAKLLKEKGFDEKCSRWYVANEPQEGIVEKGFGENQFYINAPTHQMALKWLREAHNIEISISYGFPFVDGKQVFKYFWCPVKVTEKGLEYPMDNSNTAEFNEEMADFYEEAVEAALNYVLKNLI